MPDFEITSPDGRKFRVTAPPGATKQEALDRLRAKLGAESISKPPQVTPETQPSGDDLAYRGQILPLGKTKEGKIVPALPQAFQDAAQMTKKAMQGEPIGAGEALKAATLGTPVSPASRAPVGSLIPSMADKPAVMAPEALQAAKSAAYKASEAAGVGVTPDAFGGFVRSLVPEIQKEGFDVGLTPRTGDMLKRLAQEVSEGKPKTLAEMDTLRQLARDAIKQAGRSGSDKDARLNVIIKDRIDDFIDGLTEKQITGGDKEAGVSSLKTARELAMRQSKADEIDDVFEAAQLRAGEYRASGEENALRAEFKKLAGNKNKMGRYTEEEREAIREAATTGRFQKGLVSLGKFSPTAGAAGMLLTAAAIGDAGQLQTYMAHPWLAGLPAAGLIARMAATKIRQNAAQNVQELVRGGRPISDYRLQRAMRGRSLGSDLQRAGLMGASAMTPPGQTDFNPLTNPNQL